MVRVAALFVAEGGCYTGLDDVDAWTKSRDARLYYGPWPVVAHPPCERWGAFATGAFSYAGRYTRGDDGGCFASALASVRRWGGVLEHPEGTSAWAAHGLLAPPMDGGWIAADWLYGHRGWTCCVEQGHYGHLARKPTWLYAVGCEPPSLAWGESSPIDDAERSDAWQVRAAKDGVCVLLSRKARAATPLPFRDLLLGVARSVKRKAPVGA